MAITVTTKIDQGTRTAVIKPGGLKIAIVELQMTSATFATDYPTGGIPVASISTKFGINKLVGVIVIAAQNGSGTSLADKLVWTYDRVNGAIRGWTGSTGATNLTEIANGGVLNQNSKIQFLAFGA